METKDERTKSLLADGRRDAVAAVVFSLLGFTVLWAVGTILELAG